MARSIPRSAAIPAVVFVAVEAFCLVIFGGSAALITESAFFLAALAMTTFSILKAGDDKTGIFAFSAVTVCAAAFVLEGALCAIGASLGDAALPYVAAVSLAVLAAAAIALLAGSDAKRHAEHVEQGTLETTSFMADVNLKLTALAEEARSEIQPLIKDLAEEARYANPVSSSATEEIDRRIGAEIEVLAKATRDNDSEAVKASASNIKSLIRQHSMLGKQTNTR